LCINLCTKILGAAFPQPRKSNQKRSEAMAVNYYLAPHKNKAGEQPIRISIIIYKTRLLSTVGINVLAAAWEAESQAVKIRIENEKGKSVKYENSRGLDANFINGKLQNLRKHFDTYEKEVTHRPSEKELRLELDNALSEEVVVQASENVLKYFDQFTREESISNQWTPGTMECWNAFRKHLAAQGKNTQFDHFNDDGINAFVRYLRVKCEMGENTVQKHYLNLRWFLNWAIRKGVARESEIGKIQPKFKIIDKPVIFLTKEELLRLYNYQIPANGTKVTLHKYDGEEYEKEVHDAAALEKTRDMFCFCAFTSLRYSDMAALQRTDISGDYIYITTQKTNDRLPINLNKYAKAILEKYKGQKFPNNQALPVISNQRMNEYLKEVCELCEINTPITRVVVRAGQRVQETQPKYDLVGTHAGRRTFICFALSNGIPPQVVMKWTGHSDYKAMKPYIDIAEKVKAEQMAIFEKGLDE